MNERIEVLISRAVDGQAATAEWDELAAAAATDPDLWRSLALTLRDRSGFDRAVRAAVDVAEAVDVPAAEAPPRGGADFARAPGPRHRLIVPLRTAGWAAAALVALAWTVSHLAPRLSGPPRPVITSNLSGASAAELLSAYLDRGRQEKLVVGELPERILVDTQSAPSGQGYELLYLRQILERAVVPDLYGVTGRDELGRVMPVRFEGPASPPM